MGLSQILKHFKMIFSCWLPLKELIFGNMSRGKGGQGPAKSFVMFDSTCEALQAI